MNWLFFAVLSFGTVLNAGNRPSRIASLSLASDEILMELIPKCGGTSRIAALSTFSDDPNNSNITASAGLVKGRVHSEPESLLTLKPDLVIAASFNRLELIKMLVSRGVPHIILRKFDSWTDINEHIIEIGHAIGCDAEAKRLSLDFSKSMEVQPVSTDVFKSKRRVLN